MRNGICFFHKLCIPSHVRYRSDRPCRVAPPRRSSISPGARRTRNTALSSHRRSQVLAVGQGEGGWPPRGGSHQIGFRFPRDQNPQAQCRLLLEVLETTSRDDPRVREQRRDKKRLETTLDRELALGAATPDIVKLFRLYGQKVKRP